MKRDYEGRLMRNKSFTYILPMMSLYIDIVKENLLNTFLRTDDYPEIKDHVFLLYRFSGVKPFLEYENYLENHDLFEFSYDPDRYNTLYCFKIPKSYKDVYDKFIKGRYSEFPQEYKAHIFKYHGISNSSHRVAQVLFKHPDLREEWEDKLGVVISDDAEVSSPPDIKLETYVEEYKYVKPVKPEEKPFE